MTRHPDARTARIRVRVTPRSSKDALGTFDVDTLTVRVAAAPVDGAANSALVALLAKTIGVAKSRISIVGGATSRNKLIEIEGIDLAELSDRILHAIR